MGDRVREDSGKPLAVAIGNQEWIFSRRRVAWSLVCVISVILGLLAEFWQADLVKAGWGQLPLWGKIGYSFALLILGLLVAPAARGANHKRVAGESVERLNEMRRSVIVVSATVSEAVSEVEGGMKLKLQTAKSELDNYPGILLKTMQDWEDVVPTVAEDVSGRWARRQTMLETMERDAANVGN